MPVASESIPSGRHVSVVTFSDVVNVALSDPSLDLVAPKARFGAESQRQPLVFCEQLYQPRVGAMLFAFPAALSIGNFIYFLKLTHFSSIKVEATSYSYLPSQYLYTNVW